MNLYMNIQATRSLQLFLTEISQLNVRRDEAKYISIDEPDSQFTLLDVY